MEELYGRLGCFFATHVAALQACDCVDRQSIPLGGILRIDRNSNLGAFTNALSLNKATLQIANTGSWLYEPLFVHGAGPPHPYWPGGAVILEDGTPPRTVGLLDGVSREQLR